MSPAIHLRGRDMTNDMTDRAVAAGIEMGIFRQCSIGWHDECSDPGGEECECPCHLEALEPDYPPGYQGEVL